jgi:uncharacterized membrane protein
VCGIHANVDLIVIGVDQAILARLGTVHILNRTVFWVAMILRVKSTVVSSLMPCVSFGDWDDQLSIITSRKLNWSQKLVQSYVCFKVDD